MRILAAFLATLGVAAALPAAALTLEEWTQAYAKPTVAGAGADASGRELDYGHLALRFESGRLYPVLVNGEEAGAFFIGSGNLRYTSTDPIESATYRRNAEHAASYQVAADGSFGDSFDTALVLLSSGCDALAAGAPWTAGELPAGVAQRFAEHLQRCAKDDVPQGTQLMSLARVEAPIEPVVDIEIEAHHHDLAYVRDPLCSGDESIAAMRRIETDVEAFKDHRLPDYLSVQPATYRRLEPRLRRFLLDNVDLVLVNPGGSRAELVVRETIEALVPLQTLDLVLTKDFFGKSGVFGATSPQPYTVTSVTNDVGGTLPFSHTRTGSLAVELTVPLDPGRTTVLEFAISGDALIRPNGDNYWWLEDRWFPIPARRSMEEYSYHAVFKVRKPFIAFSSGSTKRRWEEGEFACAEFASDLPMQGAEALAGTYTTYSESRDEHTVRVSCYATANQGAMKKVAKLVLACAQFYKPLLGTYPFEEIDLVELNSYGLGISTPGMIFFTKEAFEPLAPVANLFVEGVNQRLAHEVAHAWWGHMSELSEPEDQWLSESVADYYAALAMSGKDGFDSALRTWGSSAKGSSSAGTVYLANYVAGKDGERDRQNLLYGKGPLVLQALRREIGDDNTFFTILSSFVTSFIFKPAYTKDFIGITNAITKKDYTPFFDRYLFGTEMPSSDGR